jgi:hypothetical protein
MIVNYADSSGGDKRPIAGSCDARNSWIQAAVSFRRARPSLPNTFLASSRLARRARFEILAAAAVEVLNLLPEDYRARVTLDSHHRHRRSTSVQHAQIRNSIPDVHNGDEAIAPRSINPDRRVTIPASHSEANRDHHFSLEIDCGARSRPRVLPK